MRKLTKNIFWAGLFVLMTAQLSQAFSLGGPFPPNNTPPTPDFWEQPVIGYELGGDLNTPKNLGEEYRRVTPVMYYASDATFINFFGLAGLTNVDSGFALMNGVLNGQTNMSLFLNSPTNGILTGSIMDPYTGTPVTLTASNTLDSYSTDLGDFPLESQEINYTAQALNLTDLRSTILGLLPEQLGLTEPERYTWTLHDRFLNGIPGASCAKGDEEYLVVQRNFDFIDSPLNQIQYSPYVNGTLYTYDILEACSGANPLAVTVPIAVDIFADSFTSVASFDQFFGGYYTGLTRDDVGGLRYLLTTNNINFEATAPSGGLLLTTNQLAPQTFGPTLPLSVLFATAQNSDPNTLQTNYPGITFVSVTTNIVNLVTTNFTLYFTNPPPPYTNHVAYSNGMAIYPNGLVPYTNWSPVQFANNPILLTTLPLTPLLELAQEFSPAELQAIYPGLLIDSVQTNFFSVVIETNVEPFFTNQSINPVFSNSAKGFRLPVVNVLTNIYYFTNQPGPTVIAYDNKSFLTITTLDLATFSDQSVTNDPATMQALYPGLQILNFSAFPTILYFTNFVSYLTNYSGSPFGSPPKSVTLPVSTNAYLGTVYQYQFGNVFTNHAYKTRTLITQSIWTTNAGIGAPAGSPFFTVTNYATKTFTNTVSGDFFIIPTNWCGFDLILATSPNINPPYGNGPTNTVIYQGFNSSGATGTNNPAGGNSFGLTKNTYDIYTNFLYAVRPGICEPVLQFGTNYTTNIVNTYSYNFINVVTNHFYTNALVSLFITNIFIIPGGSPDNLGTNITVTNFYANIPSGDFYIVPPNWCGYQITPLLTNFISPTNIVLTNNSGGIGGGPGSITNQQYTFVEYLSYTNYTYSIRPGTCEPAVFEGTNFTTNIVSQYNYYFGNIITNSYFTNGTVTTVTTNIAFVTNGLVGMLTNVVATNITHNGVGGDFFIVPPGLCDFTILSTQLTSVVAVTNTVFAAIPPGIVDLGEVYSLTTYSYFTNSIFLVQESTCATAPAPAALRQGIGKVGFIRANYDSLVGQFFQPITNYYTMVKVTNSQQVTEYYQRVITRPDILVRAADLVSGPSSQVHPVVGGVARSLAFDQSQILPGLAGPGTILPGSTFTFDKVGDVFANGSQNLFAGTNAFLSQNTQGSFFGSSNGLSILTWASFDNSTNSPVLYPNGTSIANLVNELYIQVTPATLFGGDGTNGVPYSPVTFTASGGQPFQTTPSYIWAAPNFSNLVPGLSFNPSTQTISGTPTAAGTFSFVLQVTDAVNRVINLNYSIIIH
ncbi:MAG TPA: Ig domain-containing protein [Verrucomicrobiae bacterium]|nr:Ig domain-containing protein [Verrucomicrobiae bacterium]